MDSLIDQRFGRWTVLGRDFAAPVKKPRWFCRCDCGGEASVMAHHLRAGRSRSCGCLQIGAVRKQKLSPEQKASAKEKRAAQRVWRHMLERCGDPQHRDYPNYGARGIGVCERWLDFENYFADMWPRPAGLSMDRIDNDRGYEPGNVQWADRKTQNSNQRQNRPLTFKGETLLMTEWAERLGLKVGTLWKRLDMGWPAERALTQPVK